MAPVQSSNINTFNTMRTVPQVAQTSEPTNKETKKTMSTTSKVLIGAGVLAAVAIAGIAIKNKSTSKNIVKDLHAELRTLINEGKLKMEQVTNRGRTIEETIKNADIEGLDIKPHTYDVSQESPIIAVFRSFAGYKDGVACREGEGFIRAISSNSGKFPELDMMVSVISNSCNWMQDAEMVNIGKTGAFIAKGVHSFNGQKRAIVCLNLGADDTRYPIFLLSPNSKFTPAQQDLLKFVDNPEKFKPEVFHQLTESNDGNLLRHGKSWSDVYAPNERGKALKYANWDYDLALSVIQSMAK